MRNPWTTKNPFMSAWLSSANKVMGSARGQTAAVAKRHVVAIQAETTQQVIDFWSGRSTPVAPTKKRSAAERCGLIDAESVLGPTDENRPPFASAAGCLDPFTLITGNTPCKFC